MWAHYANDHKGLCYGFDVNSDHIVKINYVKNLRAFDEKILKDDEINKREVDYASKTKSEHWRYEKEYRHYVSLDENEIEAKKQGTRKLFLEFSDSLVLKEMIIGAKSSIKSLEIEKCLSSKGDVIVSTARPSFREFKMVKQQNPRLQK